MKCLGFCAFLILVLSGEINALRCLVCENAGSNEECQERGRVQECIGLDQACQNEVRNDNGKMRITKRCKQALACENNFIQNPRAAWVPSQCNPSHPNSVCRCCCSTDECNAAQLFCLEDTSCSPPQRAPANGAVSCSDGTNLGSECSFTCDAGFVLVGSDSTTCGINNAWTNPAPRCARITCPPAQTAPENGQVSCSRGNNIASVCTFSCDDGYRLVGDTRRVCQDDNDGDAQGVWTNSRPTCEVSTCNPAQVAPANGEVDCSNGNVVGSVCSFTCDDGFFLDGSLSTTCENTGAGLGWSNPRPTCVRIRCQPNQQAPENGAVSCSNGNNLGSVCEFTCNALDGYGLVGSSSTTCEDDNDGDADGVWSNPPPTCERIICNPPLANPENGNVSCSDGNFLGSTCTYTCIEGYLPFRPEYATNTCQDDGDGDRFGDWSNPPAVCRRVCEFPQSPQRAFRQCTLDGEEVPGDFIGTICQWTCFLGTQQGNPITECVETAGGGWQWNREPATCPL